LAHAQSDAAAQTGSAAPTIRVNHHTVDFTGQTPIEQNGHLLVPLRGVLEQLGAYVEYDSASQTVVALRGNTKISLPIGQRTATVNNNSVSLDVPAEVVNGSTMVPLRFIAESLGATVNFDINSDTVSILAPGGLQSASDDNDQTGDQGGLRHHDWRDRHDGPNANGEATLRGRVAAIYADSTPARIAINVAPDGGTADIAPGSQITLPLRPDAAFTRERPSGPEDTISIDRVHVGDRVAILRAQDGDAEAVDVFGPGDHLSTRAQSELPGNEPFRGHFARVEYIGDHTLRIWTADGRSIDVAAGTAVLLNGNQIAARDLRPGDALTVSVDPDTHLGTRVLVDPRQ
jgi:hypothetical protein